jgi:hypothetical protein
MVTNQKMVSTRISEEDYRALQIICQKEKIKPYDLLANLIKKEAEKVKGTSPEIFPKIGVNEFEYNAEADSFVWSIDIGLKEPLVISSNLSPNFVETLSVAIKKGFEKRNKILRKIKGNKSYVPESIIKFREK